MNLGSEETVEFRIKIDDDIIYSGKAWRKPGEAYCQVRINDVCRDYIEAHLPELSQSQFTAWSFPVTFQVWRRRPNVQAETWNQVDEVTFLPDWSYDDGHDVETMGMAAPITGRIDARQWLTYTAYEAESIEATLHFEDGHESKVIIPLAITPDFNDDFNNDFAKSLQEARTGTAVFDLSPWNGIVSVDIQEQTYQVAQGCHPYALIYVNAYGGWDTFLIEGMTQERDILTRHSREKEYDNRYEEQRSRKDYAIEISKTYSFHSGLLTDDEASRMHHLLNSPDVYLCEIRTGKVRPLILTGSTTEYKTFKGSGRRFAEYIIEATLAHNRIRR